MSEEAKKYEIGYLISPAVQEDDVVRVAGLLTKHIEDFRGLVGHIEEPKKIRLAYPINKQKNAYFGYTTFSMRPENLASLKDKFKLEKEIFRFMITEEEAEPIKQPIMIRSRRGDALKFEPAKRDQIPQLSPEEREASIKEIDKQLDEILGG